MLPCLSPRLSNPVSKQKGSSSDSAPFREQGNWAQVASDFEEHDEKLVKKWNDQIDTLLVFVSAARSPSQSVYLTGS